MTIAGLTAILGAGCFDPDVASGLACPDGECPPGETCGADGFCKADGNGDSEQSFRVAWRLVQQDWDTTDCAAHQLDDVIIRTYETTSGADSEDWVSCADGAGETGTLDVGNYEVWLEIRDTGDNLRVASPTITHELPADELIDLGTHDLFVDKGYFYTTWTVVNTQGDAVPCSDVGATEVWVDVGGPVETFPCDGGFAESDFYALGQYSVTLTLRDGSGAIIGQEKRSDAWLEYGASGVDLGFFEFSY